MNKKRSLILGLILLLANCGTDSDSASPIPPEYGFPANELELLQHLDRIDFISMREHAWTLWAGLTAQVGPNGESVFESWYPADNVFASSQEDAAQKRSFSSHFEALNQHNLDGPGQSLISHVMYNQAARDHILANNLQYSQTLANLNAQMDREDAPRWNRTILQFPRDAVVIKPVWWLVKQSVVTALPVWDGPYKPAGTDGVFPPMEANDWPHAIGIIPPGVSSPSDPAALSGIPGTNPNQTIRGTAPLSDFYYFQINQDMIDKLDTDEQDGFSHVQAGDYAVLIAMHVTTREIHSWVWATYWWHDQPNLGPLAEDRPETVTGPWAHFRMNTAFSMDTPGAADTGPHIVYNPYIEGKFPNGVVSNCMSCHNRASSPALPGTLCGALPITRGSHDYQPTSPQREDRIKLEFLWSILFRSVEGAPACLGSGSG